MNIFENYLKSILENINRHYKELGINKIENYKGINLEKPPSNFDCDISSNVVLILAKQNKCNPITLGNNIKKLLSFCSFQISLFFLTVLLVQKFK